MDRLKKARGPIRAAFTRTFNSVISTAAAEEPDKEAIEVLSIKLERLSEELAALDLDMCKLLLDSEVSEEDYNMECAAIEEYRDKRDVARLKVKRILSPVVAESGPQLISQASSETVTSKRKFKLPKLELIKFGGEVKEWLTFWSQFKKIHDDNDIVPEDKFQYLIQATVSGSRARELINSFPPTAENYPKAIEGLKSRFGKDELLVEVYVRELLKLVIQNVSGNKTKVVMSALYDKLESYLRALESIGMASDKYAAMLFPLVESCLPDDILRAWQRSPHSKFVAPIESDNQSTRLNKLLEFLRGEVEGEERISLARAGFGVSTGQVQGRMNNRRQYSEEAVNRIPTATDLFSGENRENKKSTCIFCEKNHESKDCFQAQKMSLGEKKSCIMRKRCCFLCFKFGHRSKNCRMNFKCAVCGNKHLVIMCPELPAHREKTEKPLAKEVEEKVEASSTLSTQSCSQQVLLQTLMINLNGPSGKRAARIIFDLGSQRSYILKRTAKELGYTPLGTETFSHALFGGVRSEKRVHNRYEVSVSNLKGDYTRKFQVLDEEVICGSLPRVKPGPWLKELKMNHIWASDVGDDCPEIELLIGSDVAGMFLTGRIQHLKSGPYAVETRLGWTLMGRAPEERVEGGIARITTSLLSLDSAVSDLWTLDKIGIMDPVEVKSKRELELAALDHFQRTVRINADGRYEVDLPWIEGHRDLCDNKSMAESRLLSTSKKLIEENRFEEYGAVFADWMREDVIEEVPKEEVHSFGHYLPHRGVFNDHSTTKVRPVFDASARTKNTPSLNDCLETGPNLIELIPSILLRFREKEIGVTADIRRAFLQISINKSDRDFLRFLWWDSYAERKIKVYRHRRVVFGVTSSPFLLGAVVSHHLERSPPEKRKTASTLLRSFYIDNCLTSVQNEEELNEFIQDARELMEAAHFDLRGWEHTVLSGKEQKDKLTPVLGLLWDRQDDVLFCDLKDLKTVAETVTKRKILSMAHQVFDPIGFSSPFTLYPKILLQESWVLKVGWDTELPEEMSNKFKKWAKELPLLSQLRVPRRFCIDGTRDSWSLHTFCDASKSAYAAVVFLRSEADSVVNVQLVQAKVRVAPLKRITIPRLELLACTIGSRLATTVKEDLNLDSVPAYYWSDSATALSWIQRDEEWGTFVRNRIEEIRSLSDPKFWRHVPGESNPADLPSRGCSVKALTESRWWEGPSWLKLESKDWPRTNMNLNEEEINGERKKRVISSLISAESEKVEEEWYLRYFSRYSSIVRMTGWMYRFLHNARHRSERRQRGELTVLEIDAAEKCLWRIVQTRAFGHGKGDCVQSLGVFKDNSGLLRVKTKITRRADEEDFRCPILLPSNHALVTALIRDEHLRRCHAGIHVLLTAIRERFWIIKGRKTIRGVVNKCVTCRRFEAKKIDSIPTPLPEDRVKEAAVFEIVGIDLAGPLHLRERRKTWIVLFTCAVYRAVHLELIMSLSTDAFLQAFRRFIARRGRPSVVYSDNGTNFVGADNLLKTLDWKSIEKEASVMRIQWKFNPPTAAWWGGWWERLIQMLKKLLRRVLGKASLTYEELMTIICDSEAVINSRPLTYVSEDMGDLVALTHSMFLQDLKRVGVPDLDHLDRIDLTKRLGYRQRLKDDLRKRFRSEYLGQLVQRAHENQDKEISIGDIVLVGSDNAKRTDWPLAKIVDVFPGKDKCVRVVRVKTSTGELTRPVQRIYPLEISVSQGEIICKKNRDFNNPTSKEVVPKGVVHDVFTRSGRKVVAPQRFTAE